jgi:hypothetical protein
MKVDIYRNALDWTRFHIHLSGSSCSECLSSGNPPTEAEMPESVYRELADKFASRGYVVAPEDTGISESASNWWTLVLLFTLK